MRPGEDGLCGSSCMLSVCCNYMERHIYIYLPCHTPSCQRLDDVVEFLVLLAAEVHYIFQRHTSRTVDSSSILVWRSSNMRWSIIVVEVRVCIVCDRLTSNMPRWQIICYGVRSIFTACQ